MRWQPSSGGTGEQPGPDAGLPGRAEPARDPRLSGFVKDGEWDACRPSAALAVVMEAASGAEWRCPGATRDEMLGMLRQWQALESWAAAGKLGLLRALIRDDDQPLQGGGYHGDLPDGWTKSLSHEVALALSMPAVSAESLMWLAWNLRAVLPGTGALLASGELTLPKARAVDAALVQLTGKDAAQAEALILPDLPGKTYGQVEKLAVQAAITVDPESEKRRREHAEQHRSRVEMSREQSGAAALSGRDLPTDQTLAAHASVCARAKQYKDSGAFPDDARMDQYRAAAYLDLLNGTTAEARIATGQLATGTGTGTGTRAGTGTGTGTRGGTAAGGGTETGAGGAGGAGNATPADTAGAPGACGRECACRECDGSCLPPADEDDDPGDRDDLDDNDPGDDGNRGGGNPDSGGSGGSPDGGPACGGPAGGAASPLPPRLADLVIPLATLLGLAERPGEGQGLGPLDPGLCRELAMAAVASPHSLWCVTVTGPDGIAIGHGCARPKRGRADWAASGVAPAALASLPARVNLTITTERLAELAGHPATAGPPGLPPWTFTRDGEHGPPGGHGTWTLRLPDGRNLTAELEPVPTLDCDHRHESHAYQPNGRLRHLVQVRDGSCTFPPCSRPARESDFEHATPYHKGGRTCGCNAGARSRQCHQVKQSPGWTVTQPRPGWHQWQTPSGRVYIQGPKRYPA
jgi:Domain of unknown function (DUF222)